jgi:hypothetical protein
VAFLAAAIFDAVPFIIFLKGEELGGEGECIIEGGSERDDESERTSIVSSTAGFETATLDSLSFPFADTPVELVDCLDREFLVDLRVDGDGFSRFFGVVTSSSSFILLLRGILYES